jgi:hypothetical protein
MSSETAPSTIEVRTVPKRLRDDDPPVARKTTKKEPSHDDDGKVHLREVVLPVFVGSHSQWLGENAQPTRSHRWVAYLRGLHNEDLSDVVESVMFHLHHTFENPTRVVTTAPFELAEYGWGEFTIGMSVKLRHIPNVIDVQHLIQFSPRPKKQHCIPPLGRPFVVDDPVYFVNMVEPFVVESYDELFVLNPPPAFDEAMKRWSTKLRTSSQFGISCWGDVKKYGVGAVPPTDDAGVIETIIESLERASEQLRNEVAASLVSSWNA